ncbi:MAG: tetratricopeptide repeat protein, partial [Planctomycetes bacterium]|nr:tetratricopeptide repeat protein [Planctomycetota bacterium]
MAQVERELAAAAGKERVPLLIELSRLEGDDAARRLTLADEALALLMQSPAPALEIEARLSRSAALEKTGDYPAALDDARRALGGAERLDRDDLLAAAHHRVGVVLWRRAEYPAALVEIEAGRALRAPHGDSAELVRSLTMLGAIHQSMSDLDAGLEHYLASLQMSERLGDEIAVARAHNNIGLIYWDLGRHDEAHAALLRALAIHERLGPKGNLTNTLSNLGLVLIELDRPREALPFLDRALANDRDSGDLYGQAKALSNLAYAHEKLDLMPRALELHHEALALREGIGDRDGISRTRSVLAALLLQRGEAAAALQMIEPALVMAVDIKQRQTELELRELLAKARAELGDDAGALAAHREFHGLAMELSDDRARERLAELQVRYETAARRQELDAAAALAATLDRELDWLLAGSGLLGLGLILLGALYVSRLRSQRATAESEQRYRTLFENSTEPMLLIEVDGRRIVDMNAPARAMCGGTAPAIALAELEPEWLRATLSRLLESDDGKARMVEDCRHEPSGRPRWSEVGCTPVTLGGRVCLLVTVRDTTEARAQEQARLRTDRLAALGTLAGGIAHDFNNALTSILGHVTLARDGEPAERPEMLDFAENAVFRARRLTMQLLAFAKGGTPVRRATDVGRLLHEAVELAGSGSHLQVELDVASDLWTASLDDGQFRQVVSNLVINAQQATGQGGRLRVLATNFRGDPMATGVERKYVRVDFVDNGPGVAEEIRDQVFDPYFTTRNGGNGLGLSVAFAICRNHDGNLTLEPDAGCGATFSAFFPATGSTAASTAVPLAATPFEMPIGGGTIL